eukprot:30957-Pelagococcus_subviridis.AAC.88
MLTAHIPAISFRRSLVNALASFASSVSWRNVANAVWSVNSVRSSSFVRRRSDGKFLAVPTRTRDPPPETPPTGAAPVACDVVP